MWNDWLSSLTGPGTEPSAPQPDILDPIETPRRSTNPAQIERLQSLQAQHQQLQVQQLHLLNKQFKLQREMADAGDSTCTEGSSSVPSSPANGVSAVLAQAVKTAAGTSGTSAEMKQECDTEKSFGLPDSLSSSLGCNQVSVKSETDETRYSEGCDGTKLPSDVWQQFHALQAQQWAQALNQARIAKRQTNGGYLPNGCVTPLNGTNPMGLLTASSSGSGGMSGGKRCKAYAAPKGVWKNNGGYNATIYVHKRRIYGPIRRDLSDAIEDRKEMEEALRELTAIHNSPEDAAILEVEMREVVAGLRNRSTPNRLDGAPGSSTPLSSGIVSATSNRLVSQPMLGSDGPRKRLRLVVNSGSHQGGDMIHNPLNELPVESVVHPEQASPDVLGPFAAPMQIKTSDEHHMMLNGDNHFDHDESGFFSDHTTSHHLPRGVGYTPNAGPIRDVYGSPVPLLGLGSGAGLLEESGQGLDMLPDSLGGGMGLWGN